MIILMTYQQTCFELPIKSLQQGAKQSTKVSWIKWERTAFGVIHPSAGCILLQVPVRWAETAYSHQHFSITGLKRQETPPV